MSMPEGVAGILLPGWTCSCGTFNGAAKERLERCRSCDATKPVELVAAPLLRAAHEYVGDPCWHTRSNLLNIAATMRHLLPCPGCKNPESCGACWMKLSPQEQRVLRSGRRR